MRSFWTEVHTCLGSKTSEADTEDGRCRRGYRTEQDLACNATQCLWCCPFALRGFAATMFRDMCLTIPNLSPGFGQVHDKPVLIYQYQGKASARRLAAICTGVCISLK